MGLVLDFLKAIKKQSRDGFHSLLALGIKFCFVLLYFFKSHFESDNFTNETLTLFTVVLKDKMYITISLDLITSLYFV